MHPIVCTIGPVTLYSYGLMVALGFLIASGLMERQARKENFYPDSMYTVAFVILIAGIVGARALYVVMHLSEFRAAPLEIFLLHHGGLSLFGGIITGVAGGVGYLAFKKIPFLPALDFVAPYAACAQAFGRIGCFLNGCCYGKESACGIYSPVHDAVLVPTQLYSSAGLLMLFVLLRYLYCKRLTPGSVFSVYLMGYGLKRFIMEFLRGDIVSGGPLTVFQWFSFGLFVSGAVFLFIIRRQRGQHA